jgi:hypothetical protein
LNYWKQSFGYYLVWPFLAVYFVSLGAAIIFDCFTLSKMRTKIEKRIVLVGDLNEIEEKKQGLIIEEEKRLYDPEHLNEDDASQDGDDSGNKKISKTRAVKDDKNTEMEGELDIFGNKDVENTDTSKPKKKKKIIKKLRKKPKPVVENKGEVENEGGDEEHASKNIFNMPLEEEKYSDPTIDSVSVTSKKKKKKIIMKKKKKNSAEPPKIDLNPSDHVDPKDENKKDEEDKKEDEDSVPEDSNISEEVVEKKERNIIHRMPNQIDVFEHNKGYWTILFFSNTFVN